MKGDARETVCGRVRLSQLRKPLQMVRRLPRLRTALVEGKVRLELIVSYVRLERKVNA